MKKFLILLIPLLILGVGGYIFYNYSSEQPIQEVEQKQEEPPKSDSAEPVRDDSLKPFKQGSFTRLDAVHYASGEATIYIQENGAVLSFENFSSANGPDLFVYLSKEKGLNSINASPGEFVSLGKIKSLNGDQTYILPEDYKDYNSVLIWCKAFSILFSAADLNSI